MQDELLGCGVSAAQPGAVADVRRIQVDSEADAEEAEPGMRWGDSLQADAEPDLRLQFYLREERRLTAEPDLQTDSRLPICQLV